MCDPLPELGKIPLLLFQKGRAIAVRSSSSVKTTEKDMKNIVPLKNWPEMAFKGYAKFNWIMCNKLKLSDPSESYPNIQ